MGHVVAKDIYGPLGKKIDGMSVRTPQTEAFHAMLRQLYSEEEAELVVQMPWGLSTLGRISRVTGRDKKELQPILERLCDKGLVVDLDLGGKYRYMPAPFVIGIFEFTMMRNNLAGEEAGQYAQAFTEYMEEGVFYAANLDQGQQVMIARSLPHTEHLGDHVEIYDYEKVDRVVEEAEIFSVSNCSCRHKKLHAGKKTCKVPLETCTSFGKAAEYLVRHDMGREISRSEMQDIVQRSKELQLVFSVDNVQNQPSFICHCCGCCCGILDGINKHGYPNAIVSSTLVPKVDMEDCNGCQKCARACHISAITLIPEPKTAKKKRMFMPVIDEDLCIGCGVCTLVCDPDCLKMEKREQHVLHPANTFERVILQCLERGTLQNQLFDEPDRVSHKAMRGIVGGFLRLPPVKKALMTDALRSRFLAAMTAGAAKSSGVDVAKV
ncbi:MAG: 4Fe-4S dicluster domain-containing protein [Lysobacterales bacterium]|jgi:ferredoxin